MDTRYLPKAGALPDCATPRTAENPCVSLAFLVCRRERSKSKNFGSGVGARINGTKSGTRFPRVSALFLAAGLAFDPHVLLLSWPAERQETVAATSSRTCEAAATAIREGRWLADDPPAAMRCERGSAFAPGSDCIQGYSCPRRPQ